LKSLAKIPQGVRYFFGEEVKKRRAIEQQVLSVFAAWSYEEIILPIFDYHNLFALGMGQEAAKQTYRFLDSDGELLALRPDLTSLVARTIATHFTESTRPIRLCYNGEVFRYKEAHKQKPHDYHQLGLEHIGNDRLEADLEVLLIAIEALSKLGMSDFLIVLSHVNFFNGITEYLNLNADEIANFHSLVDKKNSSLLSKFLSSKLNQEENNRLSNLFRTMGKADILEQAFSFSSYNEKIVNALMDLTGILEIAENLDIANYLTIDLGDVQGLNYYTGMTFKIYSPGVGSTIGSGGRYDSLLKNFGVEDSAVGFQLSLDLLANTLKNISLSDANKQLLSASQDLVKMFQQAKKFRQENKQIEITDRVITG
jgi:ATP phosphoribosyltransferase regulatory subunit